MCYMCIGSNCCSGFGGRVEGICSDLVLELLCGLNIICVLLFVMWFGRLFGMMGSGGIMIMV